MEREQRSYRYQLQFFAKEGPGGEKTEEATPKKLQDARKEGQVARSQELINALSLLMLFLLLKIFGTYLSTELMDCFQMFYQTFSTFTGEPFSTVSARMLGQETVIVIIKICLPVLIGGVAVAFLGNVMQVSWQPTGKPLMPKFDRLNPITGFKRLLSMEKIMELIKSILKVGAIAWVVYDAIKDEWKTLLTFYDRSFGQALTWMFSTVINLGIEISALFLLIGLADLIYQRMKFKKDMKMTKQEVKDEYKQSEGDPQIKGRIRQKMREASRRRMMQELPTADVVITNPTHFAVAIRYDREKAEAPEVIAKGADYLAQTIKEAAKKYDIVVMENKPLARMLYFNVEIGDQIPPELYQMVADVLVYVYRIKNKLPQGS